MRYFQYYNLLRFMNLTKQGLLFTGIFFVLHLIIYQTFFTETHVFSVTPLFVFLFSIFIMHLYRFQTFHDVKNIQYQFPLDYRSRTKLEFISIFFVAIAALVIWIIFIGAIVLLFLALSGFQSSGDTPATGGTILELVYSLAHHLVILAFIFPLAYVKRSKLRYLIASISVIALFIINSIVMISAKQAFNQLTDVQTYTSGYVGEVLGSLSYAEGIVWGYLFLSVMLVVISYRVALKLNRY